MLMQFITWLLKQAHTKQPSIKVAEAAKVIENTQRDVNIALINELALIFNKMGIDTEAVLTSCGYQVELFTIPSRFSWWSLYWVDPYYLTHKAQVDWLSTLKLF